MHKDQVKREEIHFRILTEVSQQIISILNIEDLLTHVVHLIQKTFDYYHVGIGLVEGDEVVYRVGAGILWDDPGFQFKPARLKVGLEGITGWVAHAGRAAVLPNVTRDTRYVWMQGSATRSELTVPITVKERTIGVLDIQSDQLNDFDETDIDFMQMLANQTGVAVENARLFAETQRLLKETERRANRLAIINSVQQMLASKFDVPSIYEQVGEKFRDIFDAQVVVVSTYDALTDTVEHRYAIERGVRVSWPGTHPPGGFRSRIIQTRKPLLFSSNVAEEAGRLQQPTLQGTETPKSWMGAPILVGEQVIGILSVQNLDRENAFDESDVRLLEMFAASMGIALENARLYEQARHLAALEERQRLAHELHDSVTQSLYGINLYAEAAAGQLDIGQSDQLRQSLADIQATAQESLADMRLMIYELRPPILEREGLAAAIQNRLYSVENRAGLKSTFASNLKERLPPAIEEGLFGITREALNNTFKHASARNVAVNITQDGGTVRMEVSDDGCGFDPADTCREGCLGIVSMKERALAQGWQFEVESGTGLGTRIRVEVKR